jgi:cobalt-zinc-cadmium efflux system membrane fusion protein
VTEQFLFPGDMAKPDSPIFTVMDLSVAVARAQVPEAEAGQVRAGQACSFTPADRPAATHAGRVSVVNQAVDPARRTIETWCEIPNRKRELRAGVFGSLAIVTGVTPNAVVVPLAAVQFAEGTRRGTVLVVGANHTAVKKEVETGQVFDGKVQILSGLEPGAPAIVEGGYGLPENTRVQVQSAPEENKP